MERLKFPAENVKAVPDVQTRAQPHLADHNDLLVCLGIDLQRRPLFLCSMLPMQTLVFRGSIASFEFIQRGQWNVWWTFLFSSLMRL